MFHINLHLDLWSDLPIFTKDINMMFTCRSPLHEELCEALIWGFRLQSETLTLRETLSLLLRSIIYAARDRGPNTHQVWGHLNAQDYVLGVAELQILIGLGHVQGLHIAHMLGRDDRHFKVFKEGLGGGWLLVD